jgi:hypothetical protein
VNACLSALRSAATGKVWRAWLNQWKEDPVSASFTPKARPWWQWWKRSNG